MKVEHITWTEEYEVVFGFEGLDDAPDKIVLQALSSQNAADMVRRIYGDSVVIKGVKKI